MASEQQQLSGAEGFTSDIVGMSKSQLYDIMSQMKVMIDQNRQQARQILIDNPRMARAVFHAQILLGMVRPPSMSGGNPPSSFPPGQPPLPNQPPLQQLYQGGLHLGSDYKNQAGTSLQAERAPWIPDLPSEKATGGPQFPGPSPLVAGQMARLQPLTPDMEMVLLQQVMSLTPEQINLLPPVQRQQAIQLQEMGGLHLGSDYDNQAGTSLQAERAPFIPDLLSEKATGGPQFPGPSPLVAGQMARLQPLTPDMEMVLLQQVMSLTPEQINLLPQVQRQQVIQVQEMV